MERILEQEPQLSDFGFGLNDFDKTHEELSPGSGRTGNLFAIRARWRNLPLRVAGYVNSPS